MVRCFARAMTALVLLVLVPLEGGAQTAPTAEITWDQEAAYTAETFDLTFTFSEEVSGFTADDVYLQDGTVETFPAVSQGTVFVITIRPDRSLDQIIVVLLTGRVTGVDSSEKNRPRRRVHLFVPAPAPDQPRGPGGPVRCDRRAELDDQHELEERRAAEHLVRRHHGRRR